MQKITNHHVVQLRRMVEDIKMALVEDFEFKNGDSFTSREQMEEALASLKTQVNAIEIDHVFFGDKDD